MPDTFGRSPFSERRHVLWICGDAFSVAQAKRRTEVATTSVAINQSSTDMTSKHSTGFLENYRRMIWENFNMSGKTLQKKKPDAFSDFLRFNGHFLGSAMDSPRIFTAPLSPTPLLPAAINVTTQLSVASPLRIWIRNPPLFWATPDPRMGI